MGISHHQSSGDGDTHAVCRVSKVVRSHTFGLKLRTACALLASIPASGVPAAAQPIAPAGSGKVSDTGQSSASLKSILDFRDENLIRQQYDYSCGAAALATLLRFGLGDPVTEQQIVSNLFAGLEQDDAETREREGFSLYDLQQVAQKRGYKAEGFRLQPQFISQLQGPVIVFLETHGYKHFAVLKGVRGDRVYLADPSRGNIRMPAYRFLQAWMREGTGIVFVVEPKGTVVGQNNLLRPPATGLTQPEIIGVRELLAVRAPFTPRR